MRQSELISTIAERTGLGKGQVKTTVDSFLEVLRGELLAEGEILLAGFGKFSTKVRQGGKGRNPMTGEAITIAPTRNVKFTTAKALKDQLKPPPVAQRRRA